ncbi:MAG TPA: F0F1 ATP synthase subunit B [Usitatibacteraceae bacterium]|nr:F0F1 ATP synthase subunit B [Usitatibacteraceae bacterium]
MNIGYTMLAQAVAFFILLWFAKQFVWPPLLKAIETRQKQIADGLQAAEDGKRALADAARKSDESLQDAKERAQGMYSDGEKRANQLIEQAKATAKAEADRIVAAAQEQIQLEINKAKGALREQVAQLAVAGAEKILKREVNAQAHAEMLNQLKAQL